MALQRRNPGVAATRRRLPVFALFGCLLAAVTLPVTVRGSADTTSTADDAVQVDSALVQDVANGGGPFEQPCGVTFDRAANEIVVANTGAGRIEFFGKDGQPHGFFVHRVVDSLGVERDGLPRHVVMDAHGRLLVVDAYAAYIDVCDFRGQSLARIALPAPDNTALNGFGPGPIAVAPDGRIIVASRHKTGPIHVLDADGKPLAQWGTAGTEPGQLRAVSGVAVAPNGEIVVVCVLTEIAVQIFDANGKYLRGFGPHDIGPGRFSVPNGITITPDSRIWVSDMMRHNVQVFDPTGKLVGVVGGAEGPGDLFYPSALASDGSGMFATVETGGNLLRLLWIR